MIKGGAACLADEVSIKGSSTKGVTSVSGSTSIRANNTNKVINISYNAQAHDQLYMMMFMVLMC